MALAPLPHPVARFNTALVRYKAAEAELLSAEVRLREWRDQMRRPEGRPVALCGTEGGYYRHVRTLRQPACTACKLAHSAAERERSERRKQKAA